MLTATVTFALADLASDRSVQMGVVAFAGAPGTQAPLAGAAPVFQLARRIAPYQPEPADMPPVERTHEQRTAQGL